MRRQVDRIAETVATAGGTVLLLGRPGSGRSRLALAVAEAAARLVEAGAGSFGDERVEVIVVPDGAALEALDSELLGSAAAGGPRQGVSAPILVLHDADRYGDGPLAALRRLRLPAGGAPGVRPSGRVTVGPRIIATASDLTGGAAILDGARTARVTVAPLDLAEAEQSLTDRLGGARIEPTTLRRWHAASGGEHHALLVQLRANERSGALRRRHGLVWVPPDEDALPEELVEELASGYTEAERTVLETVALAEPMAEPALLRLLDPEVTEDLLERDVLRSRDLPGGRHGLELAIPVNGRAIRESMAPSRRIERFAGLFDALTAASGASAAPAETPDELSRRILFGIEGGRPVPVDDIARAVSIAGAAADPRLLLRVVGVLSANADADDAAAASLRSANLSRLIGDDVALAAARAVAEQLLADPLAAEALPAALRTRLELSRIDHDFAEGRDLDQVFGELDAIERLLSESDEISREAVRTTRVRLALWAGDYATVRASDRGEQERGRILEWVRAPARSAVALVRLQEGRIGEAIRSADAAYHVNLLGRAPLDDTAEQQGFAWFIGHWAKGDLGTASAVLDEIDGGLRDAAPFERLSGFVGLSRALLALSEARWRDALALSELLLEDLPPRDPSGIAPLLHAIRALSSAALGELEDAVAALQRARRSDRGLSRALAGVRRRLMVQALQWMRIGQPGQEALALAQWARERGLDLIELQALHLAAVESKRLAGAVRARARELGTSVDPSVGAVILSHVEWIAEGGIATDVSEPEVRLLADLGMWVPLPQTTGLSGREREVALLPSLGYASKLIAERLHLSVRTVDAHLAKVYGKLELADREGLRRWFSAERSFGEGGLAED